MSDPHREAEMGDMIWDEATETFVEKVTIEEADLFTADSLTALHNLLNK
tara:strand:+ start:1242 stop:1388 length:147 start_codon:yes stop_codon:yes gene_type:complete